MAKHSKTKFQEHWLQFVDKNSHVLNSWCRSTSNPYEALCFVCKKTIACDKGGLHQIIQHSSGAKHKLNCGLSGSKQTKLKWQQAKFVVPSVAEESVGENQLDLPKASSASTLESASKLPAETASSSIGKKIIRVMPISKLDCKTKAEILWAMKLSCNNFSLSSCDSMGERLREMFPDSCVARDFSMSSSKASYLISHGLRPYFMKHLMNLVEGAHFTLHFDETTTTQVKKQLDVLVRYWCRTSNRVQVRFVRSLMFGHAFADILSGHLLEIIHELSLDVRYLVSISCDGPNVNKSIKAKLNNALMKEGAKSMVDIGFCNIHVVHNAFRKGLSSFGHDAEEFVIDIFYYFKLSPGRREDFNQIQVALSLDENLFIRHVQSRWLTLLPAIDRIASQMSALKDYFLKTDHSKDLSARTQRICKALSKANIDQLEVQLLFLQSVKPIFDLFLKAFQSEGPLVHCLYASLVDLLKTLLLRFIKPTVIIGKSSQQLLQIDIKNVVNYVSLDKMEVGALLRQKLTSKRIHADVAKKYLLLARSFYVTVTQYLIEKLPLRNRLLQALSCLHPQLRLNTKGMEYIKVVGEKMPNIGIEDLAAATDEWRLYMLEDIPESWYQHDENGCLKTYRVDEYWANIFAIKNSVGNLKYPLLTNIVKCALVLAHSNADSERSLSINKRLLTSDRTALSEETINGMRLIKDAVLHAGGQPHYIDITREMLLACRAAYSAYTMKLEEDKKKKELLLREKEDALKAMQDHEKASKERKETLKSLIEKQHQLVKSEREATEKFDTASAILSESHSRLEASIAKKNITDASVATELLAAAKRKYDETQSALKSISEKKIKLMNAYAKIAHRNV